MKTNTYNEVKYILCFHYPSFFAKAVYY
uniref:Uncharacterized protein n=1 Tax=Arundo donax TaxID=35708 RepID=A0A0A9FKB1_ARUDO